MYNTDLPSRAELPSTRRLLASTFISVIVAATLLVTLVLPAEYAIDPTGVGRSLGLVEMGDIKQALAAEVEADARAHAPKTKPETHSHGGEQHSHAAEAKPETHSHGGEQHSHTAVTETSLAVTETAPQVMSDSRSVTLKPGEATELKLTMNKGAQVNYRWSVDQGHLNYDTHGDSSSLKYFGYGKGRSETEQSGQLEAAFDGQHGWFWRNRSKVEVVVTLQVQGDFQAIKRAI